MTKTHSNAFARHGLVTPKYESTSKIYEIYKQNKRWIIAAVFVIILIAISTTVIQLGQDLIYADKVEKEQSSTKRQTNNWIQTITQQITDDDTIDIDDDTEEDDDDDDTERMEVNGEEVNIKKSEIEDVWQDVKNQLKEIPSSPNQEKPNPKQITSKITSDEIIENIASNDDNDDMDDGNDTDNIDDGSDGDDIDDIDKNDDSNDADHNDDNDDNDDNDNGDTDNSDDDTEDVNKIIDADTNIDNDDNEEFLNKPTNNDEDDDEDRNEAKNAIIAGDESSEPNNNNKEDKKKKKESEDILESEELQRVLYPQYFSLKTFFDIDKDNVDELVKYWKESGVPHYDQYPTKFREIQNYDLKSTIMIQDEIHNKKLQYLYNLTKDGKHALNIDYDYLYPFMYPLEAYPKKFLSKELFESNYTKFVNEEIGHPQSKYHPKWDIYEVFSAKGYRYKRIISKEEMYNKHEQYLRENYKDVELIFPENDTLLFAMMNKFGKILKENLIKEQKDTSSTNYGAKFLRALKKMEDEGSSAPSDDDDDDDEDKRRRLEGFGVFDDEDSEKYQKKQQRIRNIDIEEIGDSTKEDIDRPRIYNFNGLTSDITYFHRNRSSVKYLHNFEYDDPMKVFMNGNMDFMDTATLGKGIENEKEVTMYKNNRFWRLHEHCVRRKSTTIYPNWRILYASKPLTCDMIINKLLDPIAECLNKKGWRCKALLDYGYFRFVFKSEIEAKYIYGDKAKIPDEMIPIVLKVMKTEFIDWSTDWMRHIREAVFLQELQRWEQDIIDKIGKQFSSLGQDRAFYFVPELGHCLYPTYITVTPFYNQSLKQFTKHEGTLNMTLRAVTIKALEILSGLQVLHNVQGGPFMHTDIQPRQFMIDSKHNILINDFNRGKFAEYYFKKEVETKNNNNNDNDDIILPTSYCMPYSHGHYRAPEEYYSDPLNDKLDIWSICYTIWNLFSMEKPWSSLGNNYDAIKYLLSDYQMRPRFPYSIPPYLKDIFRHCWRQDIKQRPDINQLFRKFRYLYKHLHRLSDGRQHMTLYQLNKIKAFKETNFPDLDFLQEHA